MGVIQNSINQLLTIAGVGGKLLEHESERELQGMNNYSKHAIEKSNEIRDMIGMHHDLKPDELADATQINPGGIINNKKRAKDVEAMTRDYMERSLSTANQVRMQRSLQDKTRQAINARMHAQVLDKVKQGQDFKNLQLTIGKENGYLSELGESAQKQILEQIKGSGK